jgi:hypothetical protein
MSRFFILLIVLFSSVCFADEWPSIIKVRPSIVCDTLSQATEIVEMYQSEGVVAAAKVFKRLTLEKNENNEGKCVVTPGVYIVIEEKLRVIIQEKDADFVGIVLEVYDPRIKETVFIILSIDSKPSL